jgi:hypothetical protein
LDESDLHIVAEWHAALNAGDVDRLVALTDPDVAIGGPRGTARGTDVLREWFGRANVRLDPGRVFRRGGTVVVEQAATWRDPGTGAEMGSDTVASVFVVRDRRVVQVARHPDLARALAAAGLDVRDEVGPEGDTDSAVP